ncbi:MAG: ribbon-helix-helix domain-containing protein [Betaproteobacteria bacterium]
MAIASTRWNLVVSAQTDSAVRNLLGQRGFKKGDLSAFVEEAVRWRVFDQTAASARAALAQLPAEDAEALLRQALAQVRAEGLAAGLYDAFKPQPVKAVRRPRSLARPARTEQKRRSG